jgi:spermidine/putrescine-binding protein
MLALKFAMRRSKMMRKPDTSPCHDLPCDGGQMPQISRRDVLRQSASAVMFSIISAQVALTRDAQAQDSKELTGPLNVLAWNGYDDPQLLKGFEDKYGIKINVKAAASNANQLDQIRAGAVQFDVCNPDVVWTEKFAQSDLVLPLDPIDFPNINDMYEPFRNLEAAHYKGKLYGVPTRFGINGIVHWKDKLSSEDAADANILWDKKWTNRISIVDWPELYILMTAQWMGNAAPETIDGAQLDKVIARLIELKPNLRAIQPQTGLVKTDLANKDAWIVWGASSDNVATVLRQDGRDVELTIPKQGGSMWAETLQIVRGTKHLATAKAYLDYMTSPQALSYMAWGEKNRYAVTNSKVANLLTAEQYKILNLDKIDEWGKRSPMGKAPVNPDAWKKAWAQLKGA